MVGRYSGSRKIKEWDISGTSAGEVVGGIERVVQGVGSGDYVGEMETEVIIIVRF
jgi:hypothetical protein